jgi:hypothetical protein
MCAEKHSIPSPDDFTISKANKLLCNLLWFGTDPDGGQVAAPSPASQRLAAYLIARLSDDCLTAGWLLMSLYLQV